MDINPWIEFMVYGFMDICLWIYGLVVETQFNPNFFSERTHEINSRNSF